MVWTPNWGKDKVEDYSRAVECFLLEYFVHFSLGDQIFLFYKLRHPAASPVELNITREDWYGFWIPFFESDGGGAVWRKLSMRKKKREAGLAYTRRLLLEAGEDKGRLAMGVFRVRMRWLEKERRYVPGGRNFPLNPEKVRRAN